MGIFGSKKSISTLDVRTITREDVENKKYDNQMVTVKGRVSLNKVIIVDHDYPGFSFEENPSIGVLDLCEACKSIMLHFGWKEYTGQVVVKGVMKITDTPRPNYEIFLEKKADISFTQQ